MEAKTLLKHIETLNGKEQSFARKSVDFYDSHQIDHMISRLNDSNTGRKDWKARGFIPMMRNITKMVADKSGMIYINGLPQFEISKQQSDVPDDTATEAFGEYIDAAELDEFLINLDPIVRLLKTVGIMTQYDSETDMFTYDLLHVGNAIFMKHAGMKELHMVIHRFDNNGNDGYRVWTVDTVEDWEHNPTAGAHVLPKLINQQDNPYGIVPVTLYHDTNVPRSGASNWIQKDLVSFNTEYNIFLTDLLWATAYSMRKTLFSNMSLGEDEFEDEFASSSTSTSKLGGVSPVASGLLGPDQFVHLDGTGVDSAFLDYKGPEIEIERINDLYHTLTNDVAFDWSVRIRVDGYGDVQSGFQLVVEEIPNMELRMQRQRMSERALKRVYTVMKTILNRVNAGSAFPDDAKLSVTFENPRLPVDAGAEDTMWINRIANGLATFEDYFMNVFSLTREEAQAKIEDIQKAKQNMGTDIPQ